MLFLLIRRYIWLFLGMIVSDLHGQNITFQTLTEESIFDKQPVLTIAQDSKGKLWFAGGDDIYNYNSKHVVNMKYQDTSWNQVGYITKIAINDQDKLFIVSTYGIHIYNINHQLFTQSLILKHFSATDILDMQSIDGSIFLATKKGLYTIDCDSDAYQIVPLVTDKLVSTITSMDNGTYIFATANSIDQLQIDRVSRKPIISMLMDIPVMAKSDDLITTLFYHEQHIWIGTKTHGVFYYPPQQKKLINYHEANSNLLSNNVRKITKGPNGNIWIGTLKGLSTYNGSAAFQNHQHNSLIPNTLSQNSIYDICIDRQNIVWIGTYFGGMNMVYPNDIQMKVFSTKDRPPYRLSSDIIGNITEAEEGYWIATEEDGVNFLDKKTHHIRVLPHYAKSNLIKDVYLRNDKLYIAQYAGGYSIADLAQHTVEHHTLHTDTLHASNNVYSIYTDVNDTIYVGTNVGLYRAYGNNTPPVLIESIPKNVIGNIKEDTSGNIYIHVGGHLYIKRKTETNFRQVDRLASLSINSFYLDGDNIWLTSSNQVYRLSQTGKLQSVFEWKYGTLGSIVYVNNKLWIASAQGLIYHDPNSQYTNLLTVEDGLPANNLSSAKLYIDRRQNIFIATKDGLVSFPTRQMTFNIASPKIFLSEVKTNDQILTRDRISHEENDQTITIHLKHDENFLTFDFSSNNLIKSTKNRYRYMLQGFDKDWKEVSSPNIQYSNLPIGEHILTVYASNNDMVWNEQPFTMKLVVHPPFYLTWWAYIIYTVLALLIIHFVIKFIVEREILINSEKEHEKKIRFFTQISHEIRTPLTLITTPLDEIIAETANQTNVQQKAKRMKKNANKLLNVINELLDFRKFDEKKQQLKKARVSLSAYIEDSFYLLSDLANTKDLNYYIRRLDNTDLFPIDSIEFDKVMFNLLSNAIKYTPENGTVYLELIDSEKFVEIRIVDNGIGVAEKNQFQIFEEYYRQDTTEDVIGTGIGLALTKKIVEQHGGNITCQSTVEDGQKWTVFCIVLEKQDFADTTEDIERVFIESKPLPPMHEIIDSRGESTILIVEDNKELLDTIVGIFQGSHRVITAQNGEEGLKQAKEHMPDVILSDMMMPKMTGMELCHSLKTDVITSHIPFILLTALNDPNIHTETLQYGANLYLTKPFDKKQLYLSVRNLLAISKERRKDFKIKGAEIDNAVDQKFIASLDQLIEEHLTDNDFGVNFISRAMGMSAPILYRKLKAITDLSLNNYVKTYKLNKAKELLRSHMNISEVAYAVGFSDRKYFSKEFKKLFGVNPSEYDTEK